MIKAPFNFVPLSEKVFFPPWAEDVSHDVPFEDSESGVIDITITAKSPIFIRGHENPEQFCQYNGQYYIPGSSVKGMVRNVLEIMSFSKMNESLVDNKTYAIRDLRNRNLYMSKMKPQNIFCGWLLKDGENYKIEDCGKPGRIKHEEIDKIFKIDFASKFKEKKGGFRNESIYKTAQYKYELLEGNNLTQKFNNGHTKQLKIVYEAGSLKEGTIVLTGQASARKDRGKFDAKVYEFIFFKPQRTLPIKKRVFENFKFAYFDGRQTEPKESSDWTYWKKKLLVGEKVPVFFQKNDQGDIKHLGLSYLYKLPYTHSIHHGIPKEHKSSQLDLTQTIFGSISDDGSLKGRVQFSHFEAMGKIAKPEKCTEILGTSRASYYPIYVKQNRVYTTYMDANFELSGRKRYPIHKGNKPEKTHATGNTNVETTFFPLKEGIIFKGKLRYHNLKKTELGAILSSLTFHNTQNLYHNIGMAKSLGYGKVEVHVDGINTIEYMQEFEKTMQKNITNWITAPQLIELFSMASEQNNSLDSALKYMELKDFANVKNKKEFLNKYTSLSGIKTISPHSLFGDTTQNNTQTQNLQEDTISKTKMRKIIAQAWKTNFDIFYHPNQINEFFSKDGFKTTPLEQQKVYKRYRDDEEIVNLFKLIKDFNDGVLSTKNKERLYKRLVELS